MFWKKNKLSPILSDGPESSSELAPRFLLAWLSMIAVVIFVIALTGPPNLLHQNERRVAAYVSDIIHNGNWICQRDASGDITSKPPMFAWLSALASLAAGEINRLTLYFPGALAAWLTSGAIFLGGKKYFGWRSSFVASLIFLFSASTESQFYSNRFDGLFTLPVFVAALAAFNSWNTGRGWLWFWLAVALATLTKGPLGVVLGAMGLIAAFWEGRTHSPAPLRGSHWAGIGLFFLLCGGWFVLAWWDQKNALVDKMLVKELFSHAMSEEKAHGRFSGLYLTPLSFIAEFAPWSLVTVFALWKVWKNSAESVIERRFERFLFCGILGGIILFALSPHQRPRLVAPLVPFAALLAGREISRWLKSWSPKKFLSAAAIVTLVFMSAIAAVHYLVLPHDKGVRNTRELQKFAGSLPRPENGALPLTHVNEPFVFQLYLKTFRRFVPVVQAAQMLRGDAAAFIVMADPNKLIKNWSTNDPPIYEIARAHIVDEPLVSIVSNRPRFEETSHHALITGALQMEMTNAWLIRERGNDFTFFVSGKDAKIKLSNLADHPQKTGIHYSEAGAARFFARTLEAGEAWEVLLNK